MRQFLAGFLLAVAAACGGASGPAVYAPGVALMPDRVDAGGGLSTYTDASYIANKAISTHAWYGFIDQSRINYSGAQPVYGHASFNDNVRFEGGVDADHHHSFQAYPHYGSTGTLANLSAFWLQMDVTAGQVTAAAGLEMQNPLGTGAIGTLYGVRIAPLTRGAANWAISVEGSTPSYFGGPLVLQPRTALALPAPTRGALAVIEDADGVSLALGDGTTWHRFARKD